jgi:segregation and condensation protein A
MSTASDSKTEPEGPPVTPEGAQEPPATPDDGPAVDSRQGAGGSEDAPLPAPIGEDGQAGEKPASGQKAGGTALHVPKGAYYVTLESFEGPLDLLLHLIQQHELDITDIPIAFISEKYVEYLKLMQDLNIDLASEYLVMAATLAHIKSKMLLPAPPAGQEDDAAEEIDPRSELIRRLLEYQKYKQASEQLASSPVLGRDVFLRGTSAPDVDGPAPLAQLSIFKLFDAFQRMLGRVQQTAEHLIDVDRISISERIIQLTDKLKGLGRVHFEQLFEGDADRSELIVTFLALLEMTRLRMLRVFQEGPLEDIFVELSVTEEQEEVLRREVADGDPLAALSRGEQVGVEPSGGEQVGVEPSGGEPSDGASMDEVRGADLVSSEVDSSEAGSAEVGGGAPDDPREPDEEFRISRQPPSERAEQASKEESPSGRAPDPESAPGASEASDVPSESTPEPHE